MKDQRSKSRDTFWSFFMSQSSANINTSYSPRVIPNNIIAVSPTVAKDDTKVAL